MTPRQQLLGLGWLAVRRSGFRPYGAALPARR